MGKHEREQTETAEKIIVKILNMSELTDYDKKNHWFRHAQKIAEEIDKDFHHRDKVAHLGNEYDSTGDILVVVGGKKDYIEVKMSDSKLGIGTKANIGQDALTENNLFAEQAIAWSTFRRRQKHDLWVNEYLDVFDKYPRDILSIANAEEKKCAKARFLRDLKNRGDQRAIDIIDKIRRRDQEEKWKYLEYLSKKKQKHEAIKRFFALITLGVHNKNQLKKLMSTVGFLEEIDTLIIYYANLHQQQVSIKKIDAGRRVKTALTTYSCFRIRFPEKRGFCQIEGLCDGVFFPLMQIVFHWKNIMQGIKTPCLNIFDIYSSYVLGTRKRKKL